jgi:2'-5' RNA ligase
MEHNHGYTPHITLAVVDRASPPPGFLASLLQYGRAAGRRLRPFRVAVDANGGLYDFGPGAEGEKALWLPARSDPREALENLHRTLRFYLEREKIPVLTYDSFTPHVTWRYVPNDAPESARIRQDALVANQFAEGFWFDVTSFNLSLPDGEQRRIMLNPTA